MRRRLLSLLPAPLRERARMAWFRLSEAKRRRFVRRARRLGFTLARRGDWYSPLPDPEALRANVDRWSRPSSLAGVRYDLDAFRARLLELVERHGGELDALPSHEELADAASGPGSRPPTRSSST